MRNVFIPTFIILIMSLFTFLFQSDTSDWFAYYHTALENGEWWRLVTAHITHTNGYHLLMNSAGLIVIIALFLNTFKFTNLLIAFLFSSVFISLCLYFLESETLWYVGLSGILHALFAIGVCDELNKKDKWGIILGIGLIVKLGMEQISGPSEITEKLIAANVLVNAHSYGAVAGFVYFFCRKYSKKLLQTIRQK